MNSFNVNNSNRFQSDSVHNVVPAKTNLKKLPVKQVILGSLGLIAIGFVAKSFWSTYNTIPLKPPFGTNHSSHTNSSTTNNSFVNNTCVNILNKNVFPNLNATAEKFVNLPINTYTGENSFAQDFNTVFSQIWESQETKGNDFCEQANVGNLVYNQSTNYNGSNSSYFEKTNQFSLNFSSLCEASNKLSNTTITNTEPSIKNIENFDKVDFLETPFIKEFSQLLHTGSYWEARLYTEQFIGKEDQFSHSFLKYAFSQFLEKNVYSYALLLVKRLIGNEDQFSQSFVKDAFSQFLEKNEYPYAVELVKKFIGNEDQFSQSLVKDAFNQILEKNKYSYAVVLVESLIGNEDQFSQSLVKDAFNQIFKKDRFYSSNLIEKLNNNEDEFSQSFARDAFSQLLENSLIHARIAARSIRIENRLGQNFFKDAFIQILKKNPIAAFSDYQLAEKYIAIEVQFSESFKDAFFKFLEKEPIMASMLAKKFIGKKDLLGLTFKNISTFNIES